MLWGGKKKRKKERKKEKEMCIWQIGRKFEIITLQVFLFLLDLLIFCLGDFRFIQKFNIEIWSSDM
jgi:hypothetical protein